MLRTAGDEAPTPSLTEGSRLAAFLISRLSRKLRSRESGGSRCGSRVRHLGSHQADVATIRAVAASSPTIRLRATASRPVLRNWIEPTVVGAVGAGYFLLFSWLSGWGLLVLLPTLAYLLLSNYPPQYSFTTQYSAPVIPMVVITAVWGLLVYLLVGGGG
jgi:Predicted membrane protein (DUF2079)